MKISFENFGVIKQGEIEQKPLTILCGENNTGKTYAMYAMYGLTKPLNIEIFSLNNQIQPIFNKLQTEKSIEIDIKKFIEENIFYINQNSSISLNMSIEEIFNSHQFKYNSQSINIKYQETELSNDIFTKEITLNAPTFNFRKERNSYIVKIHENTINFSNSDDYSNIFSYLFILSLVLSKKIIILFPAERAGLNLFYPELNAYRTNLLHNFNQNNLIISKYPKPIADYIDWLNFIPNYKNQTSQLFSSDSTTLQNKILGGNYSLDETNGINFHLNNDKGNLPLHLTSSTVKTYFGLWFYLQHMAQEGDVLMIDEPELSLHPKNQRKIARLFAQLINKGIKIVISTHSDYIVREFNNLIMLAHAPNEEVKKQLMDKYGYTEDELLTKDKVGAYLFANNTIQNMEITDEGIIATTFDEVIRELNLSSDDIYYSIKDDHE